MADVTLGTCSLCGGAVTVPAIWHGVIPPTPTCSSCGAVKREHGPIIEMQPSPSGRRLTGFRVSTNSDVANALENANAMLLRRRP